MSSADTVDVVVVGGGVIGLSIAWRLRRRGLSVAVLERGAFLYDAEGRAPTGQASWAAAGMLAPLAETSEPSPLLDLGIASLRLYPEFVDELSADAGMQVILQGPGMLRLARTPEARSGLERSYLWQQTRGLPLKWLDTAEVARLEPALGASACPAVLSPLEKHIAPRSLLQALVHAADAAGVRLLPNCPAEGFRTRAERLIAVDTPDGPLFCGELVIAGGAWSGELAQMLDLRVPVIPMRGQILALRCALLLSHTIYTHDGYLVPRANGRLIVGATEDEVGFNCAPTTGGVRHLLQFATTLIPSLAHAPFDSAWAGLRPATPDHLPILGTASGWDNIHLAAGHFRNGILLAPITAHLMTEWICTRKEDPLMNDVRADRFRSQLR